LLEQSSGVEACGGEELRQGFLIGNVDVLFPAGAVCYILSVLVVMLSKTGEAREEKEYTYRGRKYRSDRQLRIEAVLVIE
jgi:hypothetical protein